MRIPMLLVAALAVSAVSAAAQTKLDVKDIENHPFTADFNANGKLRMYLRSGDFRIEGSDGNRITVRIRGRNADQAADMRVQLEGSNDSANLTVSGGPKNDLEVTIEVPRKTGLFVRMSAGNLELRHIVGNKDVEMHAGEMVIDVGDASDYSSVDASVYSGGLEAHPFGESHGGLFRSFHKEGNGRYRLHAHVGAGDLTLQ
jgi:predicted membrane GTPase involved in stress response